MRIKIVRINDKEPVGVSLLAIAAYQAVLKVNDTPLSRAGSLLQGDCARLFCRGAQIVVKIM
ncbi:hypothetical protein DBR24_29900 [Pseudomonas sp. HMWF006]|nr:hypothetical protein DBR24_29900 [Pseudomonas sp. HMWF006]PTT66115.1 hypothetical protein DBR26_18245 [Pseudomonas sp. HMWF007]PTT79247.1 hypothetical protein DBR29_31290 [Pseudomonas sp. HMWF005]